MAVTWETNRAQVFVDGAVAEGALLRCPIRRASFCRAGVLRLGRFSEPTAHTLMKTPAKQNQSYGRSPDMVGGLW